MSIIPGPEYFVHGKCSFVPSQASSDTAFLWLPSEGAAQLLGFIAFPKRGNYKALSSLLGFQPVALHLISNFLFV